ncbi:MAG: cobalamin-binding protein [Phormidesmis sp.]
MDKPTVDLRIVSLIPSATEIVAKLGYGDYLVGRSHECDFPASVQALPICTAPKFDPIGTSRQIHERVSELLISALSVYKVDTDLLTLLRPTHIITQAQCEVCAVSLSDVEQAVTDLASAKSVEQTPIKVISLQPQRLADVWTDMARVAIALDPEQADLTIATVVDPLRSRLPLHLSSSEHSAQAIAQTVQPQTKQPQTKQSQPKVVCIEWSDPLMAAGNWVPELVTLAGGTDICGKAGEHSDWMSWEALKAGDPDIIIVMPCGYDLAQTRQATTEMAAHSDWHSLKAVQNNRVYLTDGNQYFNRPGPRLVESYEILAEIIQHKAVSHQRQPLGWERF